MKTTETAVPRLGVGAVIRNDRGEILMVLRNREPEKGTWSIPGGKIDLYETMEHGVMREIKEEVNLDIEVTGVLCTAEAIRPEKTEHWVSVIYEAAIVGGELRNMEEGGAIGAMEWFPLNRLPDKLASFTAAAIEALQRRE
ncbi:NUDIX domain-containing protein [Paenibacillus timonensis]|uniref:NUDIX domain-containing protein n=1 Tax=Paenibacillus timonensis TaxID=225915 RepID=A0ABW3S8V7_9BACL|nr:NUDIX domain-containing protein [Paenibacillus timonensis]MCH1639820.1 NUDIX domain-containing protein [Paenibacillus timonensis]